MKKINKYLLIAITALMPLGLSTVNNPVQAKHINRTIKRTSSKSSIVQIAKKDARNDYHKMMNNSKNFDFIYAHPHFYRNPKFLRTYNYQLLKLGKKGERNDNDSGIGLKAVRAFMKYLPEFQNLNKASKLGAIEAIKNRSNIPKSYQYNIKYARGYVSGLHYYNNETDALNDYDAGLLADADDYKENGGKVKVNKLVNYKEAQIYKKVIQLENKANANAWTGYQIRRANKKVKQSLHLNKYYNKQYNRLFNPYNKGQDLYDATTTFASNVYKHFPHKILYFPTNKNLDSDNTHALNIHSNNYEGTMIYFHNNQATRQTGKAFQKYMHCYVNYDVNSLNDDTTQPEWKSYQESWRKHYTNRNYRGTDSGSENNFAEWRLISNRNNKNASILFLVPIDGWNNNYTSTQQ